MIFASLWVVSGLISVLILRYTWSQDFNEKFWCVSPFFYLLMSLIAVIAGPMLVLPALIIYTINMIDSGGFDNLSKTWFFRPICKKDK